MKKFVLDCSITIKWCVDEEGDVYSEAILDVLTTGKSRAIVPTLWPIEVMNVILTKYKNNSLSMERAEEFLCLVKQLPIELNLPSHEWRNGEILELGKRYGITSYDACYLDAALTYNCPIASVDKELNKAATKAGLLAYEP